MGGWLYFILAGLLPPWWHHTGIFWCVNKRSALLIRSHEAKCGLCTIVTLLLDIIWSNLPADVIPLWMRLDSESKKGLGLDLKRLKFELNPRLQTTASVTIVTGKFGFDSSLSDCISQLSFGPLFL